MVDKTTRTSKAKNPKRSVAINKLDDEIVSKYLIDHPDFFIRNASLIENIRVPHPIRDSISLPEWQMARQRNKINQLESEITLLMEHASSNELLFNQFMALQSQLIKANTLDDLAELLNVWAKSLGLSGAYLYLFEDKWLLNAPSNYYHYALNSSRFDFIRVRHLQYSYQFLGVLNTTELDFLLPKYGHVGSVALSLLGQFGDLGVLLFTSSDPQHYQSGQGTLLLEKISEILPILIGKWIMRKRVGSE